MFTYKKQFFIAMAGALVMVLAFIGFAPKDSDKPAADQSAGQSNAQQAVSKEKSPLQFPQLKDSGRGDAATMQLIGSPPMQPKDHIDRWIPEQHEKSCLACHGVKETGAPTPPPNHWYEEKQGGKIFRDYCIQCHAQQNDSKPAFNREN
ncbi:nitrate reductase cytochrome c-type subunit [Effusibacillus lacus]|uniref:Uncharacterized protein n=1 Tax=Effusibacillus lacus TaxID=1348429 RepID=A0A292YGQ7_9BACL|nr:nitrate reductase cytochrome c-type subunit [Effusibacillus lacus]TCS75365.1 periplasmic nitrate reductase subunit NapB [Effusibacillus lacus]GAX89797.1 hypothetical protein EFBL_1422 [Effusibacillus lacus]